MNVVKPAAFLIGQRVLVGDEIGTVVTRDERSNKHLVSERGRIWVYQPSQGYASHFDIDNVKPLPNGQL